MTARTLNAHAQNPTEEIHAGLPKFVWRVCAVFALLAVLSLAIYAFGSAYGDKLAKAGQSSDSTPLEIIIGNDAFKIPANMVRHAEQRVGGVAKSVDTYVYWPTQSGYTPQLAKEFASSDPQSIAMVFATFSERKSLLDMAERFIPVYRNAIDPKDVKALSNGLFMATLDAEYGYMNERLLYSRLENNGKPSFVARCQAAKDGETRLLLPCETDIFVGETTEMRVRFAANQLNRWQEFVKELQLFTSTLLSGQQL